MEEKRIKRFFRSRGKIILEKHFYHITQRAPGKEKLFLEETDYLYFLFLLKETAKNFNVDIHSFVLLPNHVHILLYIQEKNLKEAMNKIFQRYAIYFNKKYQRKGHVFCGSYRCAICNDESYILAVSLYIHLNPLKAGICNDIYKYKWNSLSLYTHKKIESFVKRDFVLKILDDDYDKAIVRYKEFLQQANKIKYIPLAESMRGLESILKSVQERFVTLFSKNHKPSIEEDNITVLLNKHKNAFKNKKRITKNSDRKALRYIIEQLRSRGFQVEEISRLLSISRFKIYRLCNISVSD